MKKTFRLIFDEDNFELHTKVKSKAPLINETMNDFIIKAIQERIEKLEKAKK